MNKSILVMAIASIFLGCGSSRGAPANPKTATYDGQTVVSYCKAYGGMPGPTCSQTDEFWVDNLGNANHTMTCSPHDGTSSTPKVNLWSLEANQLLDFKKSLVEDNLSALDSNYGCGGDKPCNSSTDGFSYSLSIAVDGTTKSIDILTSSIPKQLQDAVSRMCGPPDEPPVQ